MREIWRGRVIAARPVRIVEDVPHRHRAFWFAPGSRWKNDPREHGEIRFYDGTWELEDKVLEGGVLSFAFPRDRIRRPHAERRTGDVHPSLREPPVSPASLPRGVRLHGLFLDVRIPIDRSSYEWKDEDELAEAVARGMVSDRSAHDIRWAGERAVEHVLLREPPFDVDWHAWRPDPGWEALSLPEGWNEGVT